MIERVSELPLWGPEEQIRKFINEHLDENQLKDIALKILKKDKIQQIDPDGDGKDEDGNPVESVQIADDEIQNYNLNQRTLTQMRIENLDDIFQKQLIWSYNKKGVDDAYFYWDWCPDGADTDEDPKWKIVAWQEYQENLERDIDRTFKYTEFKGYTNRANGDEMLDDYDAANDEHARSPSAVDDETTIDIETLRHNIMRSYLEVSEWLGDGALQYGSHNGYVSRKMSLCWLFDAIRALINWKMRNQDKYAEVDIHPLMTDGDPELNLGHVKERFLKNTEASTQGYSEYGDENDLTQKEGRCALQQRVRASKPWIDGVLMVRGNEFHYGERADFYTHNSFMGECRFFHNARFLGQTTFDKEINGTAMRSRWADLAEFKEADKEYEPGTLVMFGGEKEITLSRNGVANAIVTTKPGLVLNGENIPGKTMVGIALTGTVPVKVVGMVKKFDRLVASSKYSGYARKRKWWEFWRKPIAIALENVEPFGDFVNCITKMEF